MTKHPSDGERQAVRGFHAQYGIAAQIILAHLGELESIRLADPDSGRVDDFQISTPGRRDAFQIKSSQYAQSFTFRDLTKEVEGKPCLLRQLADGWKRIQRETNSRVVVHLTTNNYPSTSDKVPADSGAASPHFAEFVDEVWTPRKDRPASSEDLHALWQPAWRRLRECSGLRNAEFDQFSSDCYLDFGAAVVPGDALIRPSTRNRDVRHVAAVLFEMVARDHSVVELDRRALLERLGWLDRAELRSHHRFPEPTIPYRPLEASVELLKQSLDGLPGGYIAVLGSPGSGKSTLLSKVSQALPGRVVAYYCYVPEDSVARHQRGEAFNFLHDLVHRFRPAGMNGRPVPETLAELRAEFADVLRDLNADWHSSQRQSVIIVDGLDHIKREQSPERSLILELPEPDQIPGGVYLVIGSQNAEPLSPRIRSALREDLRTIKTLPLSRENVYDIVSESGVNCGLKTADLEQVYRLCSGHPLSLSYIINLLSSVRTREEAAKLLSKAIPYDRAIEATYESFWHELSGRASLRHVFGVLSRIRGSIDLDWVATWLDPKDFAELQRSAYHYFRAEGRTWSFFHSSFSEFLRRRTAETVPGEFSASADREFYRSLCQATKDECNAAQSWDAIYYATHAEDPHAVLSLATSDLFARQLSAFRPLSSIRTDLGLALQAAATLNDSVSFVRIMLLAAEYQYRDYHGDAAKCAEILLRCGSVQVAARQIRDGTKLNISAPAALEMAGVLVEVGAREEASRVFFLAEPLSVLSGIEAVDAVGEDYETLAAWVAVAPLFRDVGEIIESINRIRTESRFNPADALSTLRRRLTLELCCVLAERSQWTDFDAVFPEVRTLGTALPDAVSQVARICIKTGQDAKGVGFLHLLDEVDPAGLREDLRVRLASIAWRLTRDHKRIRHWMNGIQEISAPLSDVPGRMADYATRFQVVRLGALRKETGAEVRLYEGRSPAEEWCLKAIDRVARFQADDSNALGLKEQFQTIVRLLVRAKAEFDRQSGWRGLGDIPRELLLLTLREAIAGRPEVVTSLEAAIDAEWDELRPLMSFQSLREVVEEVSSSNVDNSWAEGRLRLLESEMLNGLDTNGRMEEYQDQARAWIAIGELDEARRCLQGSLQESFGFAYSKDYQLEAITRLLTSNIAFENATEPWLTWLASVIDVAAERTEGGAAAASGLVLVRNVFSQSPCKALTLFWWLLDQGRVGFVDGLEVILEESLHAAPSTSQVVSVVYTQLFQAAATRCSVRIIETLIEKCDGLDAAYEIAREICRTSERYAIPSARGTVRSTVATAILSLGGDLDAVALDLDDARQGDDWDRSPTEVQFKDGTVDFEDLRQRIKSLEDLEQTLGQEAGTSFFDWTPLVNDLLPGIATDELGRLVDLFADRRSASSVAVAVADELLKRGNTGEAWETALSAFAHSDPMGWVEHTDGGSRLRAAELLVRIRPREAPEYVISRLGEDLVDRYPFPASLLEYMERILAVLPGRPALPSVLPFVEAYLRSMYVEVTEPIGLTRELRRQHGDDSSAAALTELLLNLSGHDMPTVSYAARRALSMVMIRRLPWSKPLLLDWLNGEDSQVEAVMIVLDSVSLVDPACINGLVSRLQKHTRSLNFRIRQQSQRICERAGVERIPMGEWRELAPAYTMSLPPLRTIEIPHVSEPPSNQADTPLIRPFGFLISLLAKAAGIEEQNLVGRVSSLMTELGGGDHELTPEHEALRRSKWNAVGLRLTFHRPRVLLARRAIYYVLGDLVDAKAVTPQQLGQLDFAIRTHDPHLVIREPDSRPGFVALEDRDADAVRDNRAWVESAGEGLDSCIAGRFAQGWGILGEETMAKWLQMGEPREIRQSSVAVSRDESEGRVTGVADLSHGLVASYHQSASDCSRSEVVVRNYVGMLFNPGADWLAFHPGLAQQLGWCRSDEGLFGWADSEGRLMVKSVWWVDGVFGQGGFTTANDRLSEGWLVLASPIAWAQVQSHIKRLCIKQAVDRVCTHGSGQPARNQQSRTMPLKSG